MHQHLRTHSPLLATCWIAAACLAWSLLVLAEPAQAWEPSAEAPAATAAAPEAHGDAHGPTLGDAHGGEAGHGEGHGAGHHVDLGPGMPLWSVTCFVLILLCIAVFPLTFHHWWEDNKNKAIVSGLLAAPILVFLLGTYGADGWTMIQHLLIEYVSFIVLLAALYVISGGVYIKGSLNGTPLANTGLLALGALIASFIGTTGASVLLIRPLLRANKTRLNKVHVVVFFIFIVSNCGGLLTPLGDPPLFLGFLKGVPFTWTFQLWQQWLLVNLALLVIFNVWDQLVFAKEEKERAGSQLEEVMKHEPLAILGGLNFVFLLGVVFTIYFAGDPSSPISKPFVKEAIMTVLALAAYFSTAKSNREANNFTFVPIIEVAVLFIGIFITMGPALAILNSWGAGHRPDLGEMPVKEVWHYFWATGILSSFLDNAPTYLTFGAVACGEQGVAADSAFPFAELLQKGELAARLLAAISCAAVFMGANTYIGNGPNFMVKAIAEENGVKMPSFFGYMAYSCGILIPLFVVVTLVFFR